MAEEMKNADDPAVLQALRAELSELREERKKAARDLRQLDSSIVGTLRRFLNPIRLQDPAKSGNGANKGRTSLSGVWIYLTRVELFSNFFYRAALYWSRNSSHHTCPERRIDRDRLYHCVSSYSLVWNLVLILDV